MRKLFLKIVIICLLPSLSLDSYGQDTTSYAPEKSPSNFWKNCFVGGNIGLQFGTVTFIEISPLLGYRFNKKISAGVGITYQYYRYKDANYSLETNVYGGRVFGRYHFNDYLFAHGEFEYLNLEAFDFKRRRVDVTSLLVGGGYIQRFSKNAGLTAMILYNLTESVYTPYQNPIIRIGFTIGI